MRLIGSRIHNGGNSRDSLNISDIQEASVVEIFFLWNVLVEKKKNSVRSGSLIPNVEQNPQNVYPRFQKTIFCQPGLTYRERPG